MIYIESTSNRASFTHQTSKIDRTIVFEVV